MKTRLIIAASLFVISFAAVVVSFAGIGMYCKQSFYGQNVPFVCADVQPDASSFTEIIYTVSSWLLLLGLPTLIALLYAHFGWPKERGQHEEE
jgi:hypothetical protein